MYFFYVLYSPEIDKFYTGITADLQGRIRRHHTHHKGFTGKSTVWELIYAEIYPTKTQALQREFQVKRRKSRKFLESLTRFRQRIHPGIELK